MCRHKKPLDTPRYKPKKTPKKMKRWPNKPPKTTVSLNTRKRRIRLVTMLKGMFLSKQMEELTDRYLHLAPTPFLSRLRWWKVLSSLLDVDKRLRSHRSITSRAPMSKLYRTTWMEGKKRRPKKEQLFKPNKLISVYKSSKVNRRRRRTQPKTTPAILENRNQCPKSLKTH